ncbi:hypothetical protein BH09VER1_BH09VER1_05270 [soil metagenome]
MSTVTAILEPEADGTLHLPVPEAMRHGKVEVIATLRSITAQPDPAAKLGTGILERLRKTQELLGPIAPDDGLSDVWLAREGGKPDPLES